MAPNSAAIAVVGNRVTRLGYVYDAAADRISEAAWLVAFWLIGVPGWRRLRDHPDVLRRR